MNVLDNISRVSRQLMLNQPFYGLFLSSLNKVLDKRIPTAGVSKAGINVQLSVNPEFWEGLSENVRYGVLLHELIHICLQHLNLRDKYSDKKLANISMDIHLNQLIDPKYRAPWFLHTQSFGDLGLEPLQDTDYYYKKLQKEAEDNPEGELAKYLDGEGDQQAMDAHEFWAAFEGLSDAEKKVVMKQVEYQMKATAQSMKSRGLIPGELEGIIDKILNPDPPKFDWKGYMRRFAGAASKVYTKKLRRKQSKRFSGNPGLKIKQKKRILVFNDSSGSVSDADYMEFMSEIFHIHKTGTEVTFADFDTQVTNIRVYKQGIDVSRKGYGGTDFNPCMSYFNEHKSKYQSCIVFTDGYCSAPEIQPQGRVLWVICSNGTDKIELPGSLIKLN